MDYIPILPAGASLSASPTGYLVPDTPEALELAIETFLATLDSLDDNDGEPNFTPCSDGLPGDPSDTEWNGDDKGDQAWLEGSRQPQMMLTCGEEDDEDDDPDGGDVDEDVPGFEPRDLAKANHWARGAGCPIGDPDAGQEERGELDEGEAGVFPNYAIDQTTGPLQVPLSVDRKLMLPHLKRIRETRCDKIEYRSLYMGGRVTVEYRLRTDALPPITQRATLY